jgi:hypothetical protein
MLRRHDDTTRTIDNVDPIRNPEAIDTSEPRRRWLSTPTKSALRRGDRTEASDSETERVLVKVPNIDQNGAVSTSEEVGLEVSTP